MGFIDMEAFHQAADDCAVPPHPLTAGNLACNVKIAYLGGVIFAVLVDDGKLAPEERKRIRELGLSLGLLDKDIIECIDNVTKLKSARDKLDFVKDVVSELKNDRDTALFFYGDMVRAMTADGEFSPDALSFLDGMVKFLGLSEADGDFLQEYGNSLYSEQNTGAAIYFYYKLRQKIAPDGFWKYFAMNADQRKMIKDKEKNL